MVYETMVFGYGFTILWSTMVKPYRKNHGFNSGYFILCCYFDITVKKFPQIYGKSSGSRLAGTFSVKLRNSNSDFFRKITELFRNYPVDKRKKTRVIVP